MNLRHIETYWCTTSLSKASLVQLKTESDSQGSGSSFDSGDLHHAFPIQCVLLLTVPRELSLGRSKSRAMVILRDEKPSTKSATVLSQSVFELWNKYT